MPALHLLMHDLHLRTDLRSGDLFLDDVGVVPCLFFPSSEHDGRSAGVSRLTGGSRLHARRRRRVKYRGSGISASGIKAAAESRASANTRRADKQSAILCHAPTGCALSGVR